MNVKLVGEIFSLSPFVIFPELKLPSKCIQSEILFLSFLVCTFISEILRNFEMEIVIDITEQSQIFLVLHISQTHVLAEKSVIAAGLKIQISKEINSRSLDL